MATDPQNRPGIQRERARRADGGEPLHDHSGSVYASGNALVIGLHAFEVQLHDIEAGASVPVEVHEDGIWIDCSGESDE